MQHLKKIYQLFLESTYLNACLVLDNGKYIGILLKKDIEEKLNTKDNVIFDKITNVSVENLETIIFNNNSTPHLRMKIPYITPEGKISGILLYDEFVSEFFPSDFSVKLSLTEIFNYYEHPMLITNRFKTILYQNNASLDLLSQEAFGKKITDTLLSFNISFEADKMILCQKDTTWNLMISSSHTTHFTYFIYQFIYK